MSCASGRGIVITDVGPDEELTYAEFNVRLVPIPGTPFGRWEIIEEEKDSPPSKDISAK